MNKVNDAEIRARYPEQKPVCYNYSTGRQDIFMLLDLLRQTQDERDYYKELSARNADKALEAEKRLHNHLSICEQIPDHVAEALALLLRNCGFDYLIRQSDSLKHGG